MVALAGINSQGKVSIFFRAITLWAKTERMAIEALQRRFHF